MSGRTCLLCSTQRFSQSPIGGWFWAHRNLTALSGTFGKIRLASRLKNLGRLRQVAADRARAGEKFLMGHFPATPSMSRLAGSSGTLEQDWRQALEQKSRAPPARPRSDITSQFHSVPARAPTRELEGTPKGRHRSRKFFLKFWDFGSLFLP